MKGNPRNEDRVFETQKQKFSLKKIMKSVKLNERNRRKTRRSKEGVIDFGTS